MPFTVEDLNRMEADRNKTGVVPAPEESNGLLELAITFRNALREIQVSGNAVAKEIATRVLQVGHRRSEGQIRSHPLT